MKKANIVLLSFLLGGSLLAQERMFIHKSDQMTLGVAVSIVDSLYFSGDSETALFRLGDTLAQYPVEEIDSISFGDNSDIVYITYDGSGLAVVNPLAFEGVDVVVDGAYATVYSSFPGEVVFQLSGASTEGAFKLYSGTDCRLVLNGVTLTNPIGPAINIQSEEDIEVVLADGSANVITDGEEYDDPPAEEDQDGAFFSEGMLLFSGGGSLTINGMGSDQHGLCVDNQIEFQTGTLVVTSAEKDGIHANDGFAITSGTVDVTASGDGIDGGNGSIEIAGGSVLVFCEEDDVKGIACDAEMMMTGGMAEITVSGDQSKGMKCDSTIILSGGTITVNNSGAAVLEASGSGYDPSYCTAIASDRDIVVSGSDITIVSTGMAGRGISADGDLIISAGTVDITCSGNGAAYTNESGQADAYISVCLNSDGDINISGGEVTTHSSGSAGKGFSSDTRLYIGTSSSSPDVNITTTGSRVLISGSGPNANYAEAKAVKSDSAVVITNGNITISSADDGIKSEASITINGGSVNIQNSVEGLEAPYITINNGEVHVKSSDDGINTTFGYDGEMDDGSLLLVNGGYLAVSASGGDGIDCNGDAIFEGGTVIVHGPPSQPEVGLDYNGSCEMNEGFMVISGINTNMTQAPGNGSDQYCLKITSGQMLSSSTLFHIQDGNGNDILTFQPARNYSSIIFSSEDLQTGVTYSIYTGGNCTGTPSDGLFTGGTYSGGTFRKSFTITNTITNVNF